MGGHCLERGRLQQFTHVISSLKNSSSSLVYENITGVRGMRS